ncbi:9370_t:CDS:2, partial [Dentiscutata erythropus]
TSFICESITEGVEERSSKKELYDFLVINKENEEQEHFTGEASNDFINKEAMNSEFEIDNSEEIDSLDVKKETSDAMILTQKYTMVELELW